MKFTQKGAVLFLGGFNAKAGIIQRADQFTREQILLLVYFLLFIKIFIDTFFIIRPDMRISNFNLLSYIPNVHFKERFYNVDFFKFNIYDRDNKNYNFSIIITTFERYACLNRCFYRLLKNRPPNSEIIVVDDSSNSTDQNNLLAKIAMNDDVYVLKHIQKCGAFHSKLDGFLFSKGRFIMSLDDDDTFDEGYYKELARNVDDTHDFFIPLKNWLNKWLKLPLKTWNIFVAEYHNHVTYAFRRSLLDKVKYYPPLNVTIYRDDAPLVIPMYFYSNYSKVKYFNNTNQYRLDNFCRTTHQTDYFANKKNKNNMEIKEKIINGYNFLMDYAKQNGKTDFNPSIKRAYRQQFKGAQQTKGRPPTQNSSQYLNSSLDKNLAITRNLSQKIQEERQKRHLEIMRTIQAAKEKRIQAANIQKEKNKESLRKAYEKKLKQAQKHEQDEDEEKQKEEKIKEINATLTKIKEDKSKKKKNLDDSK